MIEHIQKTYCYCFKCQEKILLCEHIIQNGDMFVTVNPKNYRWRKVAYAGNIYWLCPKHVVDEFVRIDGESIEERISYSKV